MDRQELEVDRVVARLAHRPRDLLDSFINLDEDASLALRTVFEAKDAKPEDSRPSSLGLLDRFPLEILQQIFQQLDLQSLTRIIRVSVRGRNVALSLRAYRDLVKHAPQTLAVLCMTKVVSLHSASDLFAALTSERCATCPEYGAFLFLLTCERCCWECHETFPTRRVITAGKARKAFALSTEQVLKLPALYSMPGCYGPTRRNFYRRSRLVTVSAARDLALSIHGSAENVAKLTARPGINTKTTREIRALQSAFTTAVGQDPLMVANEAPNGPDNRFFGLASTPFPSVSGTPGTSEDGLWCKGCETVLQKRLAPWQTGFGDGGDLKHPIKRAYSRSGLFKHSQDCHGAHYFLGQPDE